MSWRNPDEGSNESLRRHVMSTTNMLLEAMSYLEESEMGGGGSPLP